MESFLRILRCPTLTVVFIPRLGPDNVQRLTSFRALAITTWMMACCGFARQQHTQSTLADDESMVDPMLLSWSYRDFVSLKYHILDARICMWLI